MARDLENFKLSLLLFILIFGCCCYLSLALDDEEVNHLARQLPSEYFQSQRAKFKLPKLFNYDRFKNIFKKHNQSRIEELVRQKIFLAKVFRVFCSLACYKYYGCNYYLGLNQMSDMTPDEIGHSKVSAATMRDELGSFMAMVKPEIVNEEPPMASERDIERELERLSRRPEIAAELLAGQRSKREAQTSIQRHQLKLDDLIRPPEEGTERVEVWTKMLRGRGAIQSRNPLYEPPELPSYGSELPTSGRHQPADLDRLSRAKTMDLSRVASKQLEPELNSALVNDDSNANTPLEELDHRKSNCLFKTRAQGSDCGACYAFATVALYEWHYCQTTGDLVAFSEQFIVDCGHKRGLNGCSGGNLLRAAMFVDEFGLELQRNYPYREEQGQCPYEPGTSSDRLGYLKLQRPGHLAIKLQVAHYWLKRGPLLTGLMVGPSFRDYAGGVHDNADCDASDAHGMLMVGSGREDGKEYFLIRNSHSSSWGEDGYYKIARDRFYACSVYGYVVMVSGSFKRPEPATVAKPKQPAPAKSQPNRTKTVPNGQTQRPAPVKVQPPTQRPAAAQRPVPVQRQAQVKRQPPAKRPAPAHPVTPVAPVIRAVRQYEVTYRPVQSQPPVSYYTDEPYEKYYSGYQPSRRQRILNFIANSIDPI